MREDLSGSEPRAVKDIATGAAPEDCDTETVADGARFSMTVTSLEVEAEFPSASVRVTVPVNTPTSVGFLKTTGL